MFELDSDDFIGTNIDIANGIDLSLKKLTPQEEKYKMKEFLPNIFLGPMHFSVNNLMEFIFI